MSLQFQQENSNINPPRNWIGPQPRPNPPKRSRTLKLSTRPLKFQLRGRENLKLNLMENSSPPKSEKCVRIKNQHPDATKPGSTRKTVLAHKKNTEMWRPIIYVQKIPSWAKLSWAYIRCWENDILFKQPYWPISIHHRRLQTGKVKIIVINFCFK